MTATRFNPTSDGVGYSGASAVGAANRWDCVNDGYGSEDGDTTYLSMAGGSAYSAHDAGWGVKFTKPPTVVGLSAVCTEASLRQMALNDNPFAHLCVTLSGSSTHGSSIATAANTNYNNYSSGNLARPGGGSWTVDDFNNLECGFSTHGTADFKRATRVNLLAEVTLFAGSASDFVAQVIGPIFGAALTWAEWCQMRAMMRRRCRPNEWNMLTVDLTDEESLEHWRALRDPSLRPKAYCFLRPQVALIGG